MFAAHSASEKESVVDGELRCWQTRPVRQIVFKDLSILKSLDC